MIWKACIISFISLSLVSFPQNIIGCGGESDPYDYYVSFFHRNLPDLNGYRPFFYTNYSFLYDEQEPADLSDLLADEWAAYCGAPVKAGDAKAFVNKFARSDVKRLYASVEKGQSLNSNDSLLHNSMTGYFVQHKDLEALGYILYAKQVEPTVVGDGESWEPVVRDSVKMAQFIGNGQQLYAAAKLPFFKLKYVYQMTRLALYSNNYSKAIELSDVYAPPAGNNAFVLQPLLLSLKAGALFRTGNTKEAAYLFSKSFSASTAKRVSNYLGFKWSTPAGAEKTEYLALCKNDAEKAAMLSLFAFGNTDNQLALLKDVYQLNPSCEPLQLLAVREINKLEEKYFTPVLHKQPGGNFFQYYWEDEKTDSVNTAAAAETRELTTFLHQTATSKKTVNPGLFEIGAAYTAYMLKDYTSARTYLAGAKQMNLTPKLKDQWTLTNILLSINDHERTDSSFEAQLLPSLQWLQQKARTEKEETIGYWQAGQWKAIYRDLLSDILAKRYHAAGNYAKEALCVGLASNAESQEKNDYAYSVGLDFMRAKLASSDVEKLYALLTSHNRTAFENFLVLHNSINTNNVTDFAGTAYLREFDYGNAIRWFRRTPSKKQPRIEKNPFIDLLYDQEEKLPVEARFSTNKLLFATAMQNLEQKVKTDKKNAARYLYKLALGMYNTTYYGHAWELVEYSRSGSDGYELPDNATAFQKEYYGCFKAQQYFERAMKSSADQNFKARCLFMMAKCSQKQLPKPAYRDYDYNWDKLEAAQNSYLLKFKKNKYFPALVKEYENTAFYKEAYNSCSFLRDFVNRKNR